MEFVYDHGGQVDLQQSALMVLLVSATDADQFISLLQDTYHMLHISLKLNWTAAPWTMEMLYRGITDSRELMLEIDRHPLDLHPQTPSQFLCNTFDMDRDEEGIEFITLLDYPRPHEQTIHTNEWSLHTRMPSGQPTYAWVGLRDNLIRFKRDVEEVEDAAEFEEFSRKLLSALATHGINNIIQVTIYYLLRIVAFDLLEGTLIEVISLDLS